MTRVVLHIDRLVLKGFQRRDRDALVAALQAEMGRVLAEPQALARLSALHDAARLVVPAVHTDIGASPQQVGTCVAQGFGREIGR